MLNDIITGIAKALGTGFGLDYRVYKNDVKQGLTEPCFFIAVLKPEQTPLLGDRAIWRNPFDIHYFPKEPGTNEELYNVATKLMYYLRYITLPDGDMLRGMSISYEAVDGVLHFFVSYNMIVNIPKELPNMETLTVDAKTKKG
ncbi:MAG: hypothetical protein NC311_16460 [Muribaculaceae bacterium]|nr:hypothetical protein [Muribaculaceae bacterium]